MDRPSTKAQRKALIAAGRRLGMDVDALRALTPAGSLTALSIQEASDLLDRLNEGRPRRGRPRRSRPVEPEVLQMITPAQRARIEALRRQMGYSPEALDALLRKSFRMTMATLARRHDASRVIVTLEKVAKYLETKAEKRRAAVEC